MDLVLEFPRPTVSAIVTTPSHNEVTTLNKLGLLRDGTTLIIGDDVAFLKH